MSTYLAGKLFRERLDTPPSDSLVVGTGSGKRSSNEKVTYWVDAMASLIPAEVLALHGLALSFGTTTTGSGADAVTRMTYPGEMQLVYVGLVVMAVALYVVGSRRASQWRTWVGGGVAAAAFVAWTMLQPATAFDAFGLDLSGFGRTMIALFAAVVLGTIAAWLAKQADDSPPDSAGRAHDEQQTPEKV